MVSTSTPPCTALRSLDNRPARCPTAPLQHTATKRPISEAQAARLFAALDLDHSGYLTAAKLRHVLGAFDIHLSDRDMSHMVMIFDRDGNARIDPLEFRLVLAACGLDVVSHTPDAAPHSHGSSTESVQEGQQKSASEQQLMRLDSLDQLTRKVLRAFDFTGAGVVNVSDMYEAARLLRMSKNKNAGIEVEEQVLEEEMPEKAVSHKKTGDGLNLGPVVSKVSHIALIVSDVGKSAEFYSKVLGFKQIRRPNFDEHGAWFTAGNIELHLIKGIPAVHSGDDLIVGHISLETEDIDSVPSMLKSLGVPFRQNVSVPSMADSGSLGTNTSNDNDKIVSQYFIRDPDGYYIEICNCEVLTNYCGMEDENVVHGPMRKNLTEAEQGYMTQVVEGWVSAMQGSKKNSEDILHRLHDRDGSHEEIVQLMNRQSDSVDRADGTLLKNLMVRQTVYGDICQNESVEDLEKILRLSGNDIPTANAIMMLRGRHHGSQIVQPPGFYEQGNNFVLPPTFRLAIA